MFDVRALANDVTTRLQTGATFTTHRGTVPATPTKNYVVLYFGGGSIPGSNLQSGAQPDMRWSFRVVCVGLGSDDYCLAVVKAVRALLQHWTPSGEALWLEEADDDPPLLKDTSVENDIRYSLTLRYTLNTRS